MAMRSQRLSSRNSLGKFLLKSTILVGLVLLLWCGMSYTSSEKFPIKKVKITANYEHVNRQELQKIINSYLDSGFFYLNVIKLKRHILQIPWVYAVSIKRQWPDTVVINLVEQTAFLRWGEASLINPQGELFTPEAKTFPQGLPLIFGKEERAAEIFNVYKQAAVIFEPIDLTIARLILSNDHYWEILLGDGMVIYLKEQDPINQLETLVNLYRKITADHDGQPKSIDMRYPNGLAVRW